MLLTVAIMCAPRSLSVALSDKILTMPSASLTVLALLLAARGNLPTAYSTPSDFRSSSDLPTHATSGKDSTNDYALYRFIFMYQLSQRMSWDCLRILCACYSNYLFYCNINELWTFPAFFTFWSLNNRIKTFYKQRTDDQL